MTEQADRHQAVLLGVAVLAEIADRLDPTVPLDALTVGGVNGDVTVQVGEARLDEATLLSGTLGLTEYETTLLDDWDVDHVWSGTFAGVTVRVVTIVPDKDEGAES